MKLTLKYGLILTSISCGQKREKDIDELVLAEYVFSLDKKEKK